MNACVQNICVLGCFGIIVGIGLKGGGHQVKIFSAEQIEDAKSQAMKMPLSVVLRFSDGNQETLLMINQTNVDKVGNLITITFDQMGSATMLHMPD